MSKPGRNDPCYCGSGLKYKKCHMQEDQTLEKERSLNERAGNFIRRDLLKFARDERFAEEFAKTLAVYWDGYYYLQRRTDEPARSAALLRLVPL